MTVDTVAERPAKKTRKRSKKVAETAAATPPVPAYWSVQEFAAHFRVSESGVLKAIKVGTLFAIPAPPIGNNSRKLWRIPASEVARVKAGKPLPKKKAAKAA
ncbi:MAG: hypothetical protein V4719_10240 [Planctomycetota bacterium]